MSLLDRCDESSVIKESISYGEGGIKDMKSKNASSDAGGGEAHFYAVDQDRIDEAWKCKSLCIGTPISTLPTKQNTVKNPMCQSPIHQDTHFYMTPTTANPFMKFCVNPLYIRTPISTWRLTMSISGQLPMSVNPLYIGTPISTSGGMAGIVWFISVSIPYTSGHPFLRGCSPHPP